MAANTPIRLRNQILYSVFVRNYSSEGTFEGVRVDLDRIKALGTDIIWLMPIHPIGVKNRKGTLGSPYSIQNYREINPEFGTMDDFVRLVDDIHAKGMKCIIDVVYNHTSADSWLSENHPEWFFHKEDGSFGNRVGDWWDVIDLDYTQKGLWDYQIETLVQWAKIVDGFRCDVAPMVPVEFWQMARAAVEEVRPGAIWLAESVEPGFIIYNRERSVYCASDSELYQAFDICYDYDIKPAYHNYLAGKASLHDYAKAINDQESIYPDNYVKMRFLENHDQPRAHFLIPDEQALRNWTAFNFFQKGLTITYNGQEKSCKHLPSLFDRDTIDFESGKDISAYMKTLADIQHNVLPANGSYHVYAKESDIAIAIHTEYAAKMAGDPGRKVIGIFSLRGHRQVIELAELSQMIPDGQYENLIDQSIFDVCMGRISTNGEPMIFEIR